MQEITIQPGYTIPAAEDAAYAALETAVSAHNAAAQPGEPYWGIRLSNAQYEVYEFGEVPQPPTTEELAAQEAAREKEAKRQQLLAELPEIVESLQAAQADADALNVDQAYRLTLLELGISE